MIHWAFLIPTFVAGFALCFIFIYWYAKLAGEIDARIERMSEAMGD